MRRRPHTLSTRLDPAELAAFVAALEAPGGGWFVPSAYARWALLRPGQPAVPAAVVVYDPAAILSAVRRFRSAGRNLNWIALGMNAAHRLPSPASLDRLGAAWTPAAAEVRQAVAADRVPMTPPVPLQAEAPAMVYTQAPTFAQAGDGRARQRHTVVSVRLDDAELAQVQAAALFAAADPADHFRARLLDGAPIRLRKLPRPVARALAAVQEECGRQVNNWSQIARAHGRVHRPVPAVVLQALTEILDIRNTIVPELARWRS